MKSFRSNPGFQEKALKSVKTEILKRQPTILSTTYTTTTPSPIHANSLDFQSTTSKALSTTPYELDEYMSSNVPFTGHDDVL
ncbi:unnamed protein product [Rotaria sordida]|uniref:Uncharacterized protein n=1 Tax=Rotaria sordida TaxID=392033 RepID=A0A815LRR6_9BILA|nr:unnamed protein product [Rotaria sordida]CAF1452280.1 unnamed protein product [Rotaria sordida]CAF3957267.1 unnamed protein product [Rotaria sordida]CAF4209043.1 unnamed protein product [Rotaria sordida]